MGSHYRISPSRLLALGALLTAGACSAGDASAPRVSRATCFDARGLAVADPQVRIHGGAAERLDH